MKEDSQNPKIDPELEARIVALVLGEASDFERDELNRIIDQRPELAKFKQEIQNVHGLLRTSATGESIQGDEEWNLPAEKRNVVLSAIQDDGNSQRAAQVVVRSVEERKFFTPRIVFRLANVAAVLLLGVFVTGIALIPLAGRPRIGRLASKTTDMAAAAASPESSFGNEQNPFHRRRFRDQARSEKSSEFSELAGGTELDFEVGSEPPDSSTSTFWEGKQPAVPSSQNLAGAENSFGGVSSFQVVDEERSSEPHDVASQKALGLQRREVKGESIHSGFKGVDKAFRASGSVSGEADLSLVVDDDLQTEVLFDSIETPAAEEVTMELEGSEMEGLDSGIQTGGGLGGGGLGGHGPSGGGGRARWDEAAAAQGENMISANESQVERNKSDFDGGREFDRSLDLSPADSPEFENRGIADHWQRQQSSKTDGLAVEQSAQEYSVDTLSNGVVNSSDSNGKLTMQREERPQESLAMPSVEAPGRGERPQHAINYFDSQPRSQPAKGKARIVQSGKKLAENETKQRYGWGASRESERISSRYEKDSLPTPTMSFAIDDPDRPTTATVVNGVARDLQEQVEYSLGEITRMNEVETNSSDVQLFGDSNQGINRGIPSRSAQMDGKTQGHVNVDGENVWHDYVLPQQTFGRSPSSTSTNAKPSVVPSGINEKTAAGEAFSTFSLHVSDVSFQLARAALAKSEWPDASRVRIEEFVNAFDYGDPMPSQSEKVACRLEQSIHPFLQQRNLLRISMRTAAAGRSSKTPLRLTLLLDNSGSMERTDRQLTVRRAFSMLAKQLKPIDRVTLISFARQPRLLADNVSGDQCQQLVNRIRDLPSEGGTNFEAALQLAFEKAKEHQNANAQNRIILLTDGAVNLGDAEPNSLSRRIVEMRNAGISFDAAGISADGLNDEVLEALTRKGDGRYYLLDFPEAADRGFARQIAGALRPSAKNVKVQIEFNPKRVGRYKLLGFEKHRLKKEDFRNDKVDAAEMAAAEAGVAVYQLEAKPGGEGDIGSVSVRFLDLSSGQMVENRWPIPYEPDAPRVDQAAPSLRLAATAALFAAKLRGEPLGESVDLRTLSELVAGFSRQDRNARIESLQQMIQQARQISGP